MPANKSAAHKRMFNGDRAWHSTKIRQLPERYRAEYAWLYSIALADGTFECDPQTVFSLVYSDARGGSWSVQKVEKLLEALREAGLLLVAKDPQGKDWGYWVGCESELPSESERYKYKTGKPYLFHSSNGTGTTIAEAMSEVENGVTDVSSDPESMFDEIQKIWTTMYPGAACEKPRKGIKEWWDDVCFANKQSPDVLLLAFKLWANAKGDPKNSSPVYTFLKSGIDQWRNIAREQLHPQHASPKIVDDQLKSTLQNVEQKEQASQAVLDAQFKDAYDKQYGLGKYAKPVNEQPQEEGDGSELFEDEKQ